MQKLPKDATVQARTTSSKSVKIHPMCGTITRFMTLIYNPLKLVFRALTSKILMDGEFNTNSVTKHEASQVASQLGVLQCG